VPGVFRYVECGSCQTVYQNPRVRDEDLALCYPAGYFTHGSGRGWVPTPAPTGSVRERLRCAIRRSADGGPDAAVSPPLRLAGAVLALHPGLRRRARFGLVDGLEPPVGRQGRCLEVGPGAGVDLFCLRALGWDAHGLEIDPVAAERARRTSGCEVRLGTIESADYPPGLFDLVYMSHVFEHLPDPARALERCLELLAPGGRLVLVYPNPRALTVRFFERFSCVYEPPRHLVLPPVEAAASLLRTAGFADVHAETSSRHATRYFAASRSQRSGVAWDWSGPRSQVLGDRLLGSLEALLVALGLSVGEEAIVRARTR
jgi:SAM-dependent methyltransferase